MSLSYIGYSGTDIPNIDVGNITTSLWLKGSGTLLARSARRFTAANSEYCVKSSGLGSLDPAGTAFTVGGWYYRESSQSSNMIDCRDSGNANAGFSLYVASNLVRFVVGGIATVASGGLSLNGWTLAAGKWDGTNALRSLGGAAFGQSIAASWVSGTLVYAFGRYVAASNYFDGRMGPQFHYSKALSDGEISALNNSNAGLGYNDLSAGQKTNLVAWWEMNEISGDVIDRVSGITLTDTNTVTYEDGLLDTGAYNMSVIRKWNDDSGNAKDASQATHASRPYYSSGSPKRCNFDGTDDVLTTGNIAIPAQYSVYAVCKAGTSGARLDATGQIDSSNIFRLGINASNNVEALVYDSTAATVTANATPLTALTTRGIIGLRVGATSISCSWNGRNAATTAMANGAQTHAGVPINIGNSKAASGNNFNGEIGEIVFVPSRLSDNQQAGIIKSIAARHSITL